MASLAGLSAVNAQTCARVTPGVSLAAEQAANLLTRALWLDRSPNLFLSYEAKSPPRNPFDKTEPTAAVSSEPVQGIVWAQGLYCLSNLSPDGKEVLVRTYARVTAFFEGKSWDRPIKDGLVHTVLAAQINGVWSAKLLTVEQAIFLPGASLRAARLEEIPAFDRRLGIPCATGTYWSGQRCETAKVVPQAKIKG